jgi:tRNA(Ile)-lysidine synthase
MHRRVAEIIIRYNMLPDGGRVGVAVSGGADSVVLLHILTRLAPQFRIEPMVLHVNHELRGEESEADEAFVRGLAEWLHLPVLVERSHPGEGNLEQAAREIRRSFFRKCMAEQNLACVALGHTRSDQAETVLFRFLRGSGLTGLAGMRPVTPEGFIRPLLTSSRTEIRTWAAAEGISWREDSSNESPDFARNRLRRETMPALAEAYNPNLESVLAGMADLASAEEDYWNQQVGPVYEQITRRSQLGSFFQIDALMDLHPALRRRVMRHAIKDVRGDLRSIDFQHVEAILNLCNTSQGHDRVLVPGVDAIRSFDTLLLTRPGQLAAGGRHYRVDLRFGEEHRLPFGAGIIYMDWAQHAVQFCANFKGAVEVEDLDAGTLAGESASRPLYVRNWEPGDEIQRPGHAGAEKIKSLFQEYRVVLWERRHWPVVVLGEEIVWVRRFGIAAKFKGSGQSRHTVRLIYQSNLC